MDDEDDDIGQAAGLNGEVVDDWSSEQVKAWDAVDRYQRASRTNGAACSREVLGPCWTEVDMQNIKPSVRGQQAWARSGSDQRPSRPWMVPVWGRSRPVGGLTRASRSVRYEVHTASTSQTCTVVPVGSGSSVSSERLKICRGGRCGKEPRSKQCGRGTRTSALRNEAYWPATRDWRPETRLSARHPQHRRSARSQC